jgi:small subunit ribosomal protein S16
VREHLSTNDEGRIAVAVKLRLMRMGKKKQPTYRVVAADSRSPRNGRFIEIIGTYDPRQEPSVVKIDTDKAADWISKGAQPTETVARLLKVVEAQPAPAADDAASA